MANRSRIRRVPFARFPFRRGFRRSPPRPWLSGVFNETGQLTDGSSTFNAMRLHSDMVISTSGSLVTNAHAKIHRVQAKGTMQLIPLVAATQYDVFSSLLALVVADADDTQTELWGSSGNVFVHQRILWWTMFSYTLLETATQTVAYVQPGLQRTFSFDVKSRRGIDLPVDHKLFLVHQFNQDVTTVVSAAYLSMLHREVVKFPGTR